MLPDFSKFVTWASTSDLRRLDHDAVRRLSLDRSEGAAKIYQNGAHHKNQSWQTQCPKVLIKPVQTNSDNYDVDEAKIREDGDKVYCKLLVGF